VSSRNVAKSLLGFGLKNQIGKIVGQLQAQYAKFLLSGISAISLSAYVIGSGLVQKFAGGIAQLATALYPAVSRDRKSDIRSLYYKLQLGLLALGFAVIAGYEYIGYAFLSWWLHSPELVPLVHSVMRILVWYLAILMLTPIASTMLDGRARPEITSFLAFITAAIEIMLAIILLPQYGLFAPVYGSLIAVALTTPLLLYKTHKILSE
jgi:O-antigen/teichoic acid export membrane protein